MAVLSLPLDVPKLIAHLEPSQLHSVGWHVQFHPNLELSKDILEPSLVVLADHAEHSSIAQIGCQVDILVARKGVRGADIHGDELLRSFHGLNVLEDIPKRSDHTSSVN